MTFNAVGPTDMPVGPSGADRCPNPFAAHIGRDKNFLVATSSPQSVVLPPLGHVLIRCYKPSVFACISSFSGASNLESVFFPFCGRESLDREFIVLCFNKELCGNCCLFRGYTLSTYADICSLYLMITI